MLCNYNKPDPKAIVAIHIGEFKIPLDKPHLVYDVRFMFCCRSTFRVVKSKFNGRRLHFLCPPYYLTLSSVNPWVDIVLWSSRLSSLRPSPVFKSSFCDIILKCHHLKCHHFEMSSFWNVIILKCHHLKCHHFEMTLFWNAITFKS